MLLGHGYIMNGGLEHFEDLSEDEQHESIGGFRFFSFNDIADMILRVPKLSKKELADAGSAFGKFDAGMLDKVKCYINANPHQFRSP